MKKFYLLLVLIPAIVSKNSFSQDLTVSLTDTIAYSGPVAYNDFFCKYDTLFNNANKNLDIEVTRLQDVSTFDWESAFCLDQCYVPTVGYKFYTLTPYQKQELSIHFYNNSNVNPAMDSVYFEFKNANDTANVFYQKFYGNLQLSGVNEKIIRKAEVKIAPSPVKAGEVFSVRISNAGGNLSLVFYNQLGETATATSAVNGVNFMQLELPAGIYGCALFSGKEKLYSGKLVMVR